MNKTELITAMAEASGLTKKDCDTALNAFVDTLQTALKSGDKVQLLGFGTFEVKERAARIGKNPATGATIEIPASKAPAFKPGNDSMLNMTETSKKFLEKWLPDVLGAKHPNDILDPLYDLIEIKGFNAEDAYNDFGREAQAVYDDIYWNN